MKRSDLIKLKKIYSDDNNIVYDARNSPFSIFSRENTGFVLDENIVFGKDYPTGSFDYDTYQILLYLKNEPNLDKIFENLEFKTVHGDHLLRQNIIENNYITPIASDTVDIEEEILKMNANELTNILKKHGITASGKKKKLVKLALENVTSLDFENCEFELTKNGKKFLNDFEWIDLYDVCLNDFEFDDFYKFIDENESSDLIQIGFKYIDRHLAHAHECEDFGYVSSCINARAFIYVYADEICESLKEEIKNYIFRINPIYDYEDYYSLYVLLNYYDIDCIRSYTSQLEINNLEEIFNNVWDSMKLEKEFISKKEAYNFLNELFDEEKFDDLCENYLNEVIF
ncbi:MAG: hypothetical protein IJ672_02920 [Methanobrevibacter sp.]|nr:hypothetical protein [Methanobrevibacter sp.]